MRRPNNLHVIDIPYSAFLDEVTHGHVRLARLQGQNVTGMMTNGTAYRVSLPTQLALADALAAKQVQVSDLPDDSVDVRALLLSWLPLILYYVILWLFVGLPLKRLVAALERIASRS